MADKYFNGDIDFHSVIYSLDDVRYMVEGREPSCGVKKKLLEDLQKLQATAKPIEKPKHDTVLKRDIHLGRSTLSSQFNKRKHPDTHHGLHKRTETVTNGRYCSVLLAADHTFVNSSLS